MKVVYFGTIADEVSPRVRILREGLRRAGVEVVECRARGVAWSRYPKLARSFLPASAGADVVLVAKPGQREVPLGAALARARGVPVVHDFFVSLFVNEVRERARVEPGSFEAWKLKQLDRWALDLVDLSLVDTDEHGTMIRGAIGTPNAPMRRVVVGAEDCFQPRSAPRRPGPFRVLFVGTFISFHGTDVILQAARRLKGQPIEITLLGDGQQLEAAQQSARDWKLDNVRFEPPIPYAQLPDRMHQADLLLGIFGTSPTARAVIPKKVYAGLAAGKPVLTARTAATRELIPEDCALWCDAGDPASLAEAIQRAANDPQWLGEIAASGRAEHERRFCVEEVGRSVRQVLEEICSLRKKAEAS